MKYFSTQRPVTPGSYPKPEGNRILEVWNFDKLIFCPEVGQEAWGRIEYEHPLTDQEAENYELTAERTMETYAQMCQRQQAEVNALPLKFAFDNKQFREMMEGWGLDPKKDTDKIYKLGDTGGFYKKTDSPLIRGTFDRHDKEREDAIAADKTGDGFIYQMFLCELSDYEYNYTGEVDETLAALGYTSKDIMADKRLRHGLTRATNRILMADC